MKVKVFKGRIRNRLASRLEKVKLSWGCLKLISPSTRTKLYKITRSNCRTSISSSAYTQFLLTTYLSAPKWNLFSPKILIFSDYISAIFQRDETERQTRQHTEHSSCLLNHWIQALVMGTVKENRTIEGAFADYLTRPNVGAWVSVYPRPLKFPQKMSQPMHQGASNAAILVS